MKWLIRQLPLVDAGRACKRGCIALVCEPWRTGAPSPVRFFCGISYDGGVFASMAIKRVVNRARARLRACAWYLTSVVVFIIFHVLEFFDPTLFEELDDDG